jgi:hypothetical protein
MTHATGVPHTPVEAKDSLPNDAPRLQPPASAPLVPLVVRYAVAGQVERHDPTSRVHQSQFGKPDATLFGPSSIHARKLTADGYANDCRVNYAASDHGRSRQ